MSYKDIIEQKKKEREDNLLQANNNVNDEDKEEVFTTKFFGVESIRNLPACLDLRFADGNCEAIPYSLITAIKYSIENGITIQSVNTNISVKGTNLKQLYNYMTRYRIYYIQEHIGTNLIEEGCLAIEEIEIS